MCITGLSPETTPTTLVDVLRRFDVDVAAECVRVSRSIGTSDPKATIKVEDPSFATALTSKLDHHASNLKVATIPNSSGQLNGRKVHISWHKSTRSVWLNFGNGEIANRVARKFREGKYNCLGRNIKSTFAKHASSGEGRSNPVAWTITLSDVPSDATSEDINTAIRVPYDRPRHIELGPISCSASHAKVSVVVRSRLEEHGILENFYLSSTNQGKRIKATALFSNEADARSACSMNNRSLDVLGKGKLTVTMIQSVKLKISTAVYIATKGEIGLRSKSWREQLIALHVYTDPLTRYTTLKVDGSNLQDIASVRKTLDQILSGITMKTENDVIWSPLLAKTGRATQKLQAIAQQLNVLIIRNKILRHLQYYGSIATLEQAINQVAEMLKEESLILLDSQKQQNTTVNGSHVSDVDVVRRIATLLEGTCPICFDNEPDTPINTSCGHSYCLECFENSCKSAASTSMEEFKINCQGDEGRCTHVFKLAEVKDYLSSSAFELVLKTSFEEHVKQHPDDFHYCPTPDCGFIYRCTLASDSSKISHTCPNCLEKVCTSCHARHGDYTCAEYTDIESGGYEALQRLKKELNIKDCPKCRTPMEKTEGCNHMVCGGCSAHICWVCMAVFNASGPCYAHMNQAHGGIGLDHLNRFA